MAIIHIPCKGTLEVKLTYKFTPDVRRNAQERNNRPVSRSRYNGAAEPETPDNRSLNNKPILPTILVLFVKADSASNLVDTIRNKGSLYEGAETVLFVNAMKMWAGTDELYSRSNVKDEFNREESKDSFVKEYDYVAMRFLLSKAYKGYSKGEDSYERNQFFTDICKDRVQLIECSKRLSFDEVTKTDAYDVY